MTIAEVKEMYKDQYTILEVYMDKGKHQTGFHTDGIIEAEEYSDNDKAIEWELMSVHKYSNTVLASTDLDWEDCGMGDQDRILVIKIEKE